MKQTPCEYIVWNGLPVIRKGLAVSMINDFGLSNKETAEKLCISSAAVSQYVSGKRGKMAITDTEICEEINKSAKLIIQQGDGILNSEMCRLCKLFLSKKLISFI